MPRLVVPKGAVYRFLAPAGIPLIISHQRGSDFQSAWLANFRPQTLPHTAVPDSRTRFRQERVCGVSLAALGAFFLLMRERAWSKLNGAARETPQTRSPQLVRLNSRFTPARISATGMVRTVQFLEPRLGDVGINLGGGEVRVAEHHLHRP